MASLDEVAEQTLTSLEERLERIKFLLNGDISNIVIDSSAVPVQTRLRNIERALQSLTARSYAAADIIAINAEQPDLFHASSVATTTPLLSDLSLAHLVLAHDQLYTTTAAQLPPLQEEGQMADQATFAKIIALQPRVEAAQAKQIEQAKEIAALRARSAKLLERWYQDGVLDMGGRWAEWEAKLRDAEILLRRREAAKKREDSMV